MRGVHSDGVGYTYIHTCIHVPLGSFSVCKLFMWLDTRCKLLHVKKVMMGGSAMDMMMGE